MIANDDWLHAVQRIEELEDADLDAQLVADLQRAANVDNAKFGIFPAMGARRSRDGFRNGVMSEWALTAYSGAGSSFRAIGRTRNRRCVRWLRHRSTRSTRPAT